MGVLKVMASSIVGLVTLIGGAVALSSGTGSSCGSGTVDINKVAAANLEVAGYQGDQLVNAAIIMNAATSQGLPAAAQTIGVMTAMGESSLRNIAYGDDLAGVTNPDGTPTSSLGLFQQQNWWGSQAERLDPTRAATLFFASLTKVPQWGKLSPTAAAHAVQGNADPNHCTPSFAPAAEIVANLTAMGRGGCMSDDRISLAQELVTHANDGTLTGLVPDHIKEIRWIAQGRDVPDCGIDGRMLQVMVIAVRNFERVGISDINRACTKQTAFGIGSHTIGGDGRAVDFYSLNGRSLTGADGLSLRFIGLLDPVMPNGSRIGQSNCRAHAGTSLALQNLSEFSDYCNHLHIDVAFAGDKQLSLAG